MRRRARRVGAARGRRTEMTTATYQVLPLGKLKEHPLNPRKRFDERELEDLESSIRQNGVIVPLLVRKNGSGFEIIGGARRFRAAKRAGLEEVPAVVRELDDKAAMELLLLDNLQRTDLGPLEEAQGYHELMTKHGYTAERIAERIGMSLKYVYDRVKLLQLVPEARKLVTEGRITAGHAILLARIKPADQKRAIDQEHGGLFQRESTLWNPEEDSTKGRALLGDAYKARSVRELEGWIAEHVRFDAKPSAVDPVLFPETHCALKAAEQEQIKVIQITHDHYVQDEARDPKTRTWGPRSWKRADGKTGSKTCEFSVLGVVVVGPGHGEAFQVCTAKEKCAVHYGREIREKAKRSKGAKPGASAAEAKRAERQQSDRDRWEQERKREDELKRSFLKARPAILEALAAAVKKAPTKPGSALADLILDDLTGYGNPRKATEKWMPLGRTAEDLVRFAAFTVVMKCATEYRGARELPKVAKLFGVDMAAIMKAHGDVQTSAPAAKPRKRGTKKGGAK